MIQAIAPSSAGIATAARTASTGTQRRTASHLAADTVTLSPESLAKSRTRASSDASAATETDDAGGSLWETKYGLKAGTVFLENGHKQKITIDDNKMEILEYNGSKLVRKETGNIHNVNVTKDIEEYDTRGALTKRVHAELSSFIPTEVNSSRAELRRDIQWFTNGNLSKEMHDSMDVHASYRCMEFIGKEPENLDDISGRLTRDNLTSAYVGTIIKYSDLGKVTQETTVTQSVKTTSDTNRHDKVFGGLQAHTTNGFEQSNHFSLQQVDFDNDGKISCQTSFSDSSVKYLSQAQQLNIRRYNKGELVQESQASCKQEASKTHRLAERPTIFESLAMSEADYSAATPLDAQSLLEHGHGKQVDDAQTFLGSTIHTISSGDFNLAKNIEKTNDAEYSISMENTLYQDGKKTISQKDTASLQKNHVPDKAGFQTCTGLTEDKDPAYLHSSSHSVELYKNGKLANATTVDMQETPVDDARGITRTETSVSTTSSVGDETAASQVLLQESLDEVDDKRTTAAQKMERATKQTFDDFYKLFADTDETSQDTAEP